ncbi:MAG: acyl-CoA carboxylase subunit beta [Fibrobacter sp.]|nr:acyl-CoA carboxylase subunit beta [Fibrobacter sp.]
MWNEKHLNKLNGLLDKAKAAGGTARIDKQHQSGKCTARERMEMLFDAGSFVEVGALRAPQNRVLKENKIFLGDGVVTGYGKVNGRLVFASSQDFTVNGGSLGQCQAEKICRVMDMAVEAGAPFVAMNDSGGARIEEGVFSLAGYSAIMARNTWASGVIPQIAVIMGPCAGGACYSPALSDFIFMTEQNAQMFLTGPSVVKQVMGETITAQDLGGAAVHSQKSGVAHFVYADDKQCLDGVRKLLEYLPQSNKEKPVSASEQLEEKADENGIKKLFKKFRAKDVSAAADDDHSAQIQEIVPDNYKQAYDVAQVIAAFADADSFFEVQKDFGKNVVIGFARLDGEVVGIVANQPRVLAGSLDVDGSDKAGRFVRFCDAFNIPLLALVDVPGYMPGSKQEGSGIIRHGAKLLYAFAEATVPKVTLILRKAFGGAYIAMNSKDVGADYVFALPIAQVAVMGAEGAVEIIHKKDIAAAADPVAARQQFIAQYEEDLMNPYVAASMGVVDEVIRPEDVRGRLKAAFDALKNKDQKRLWKKHSNIPL